MKTIDKKAKTAAFTAAIMALSLPACVGAQTGSVQPMPGAAGAFAAADSLTYADLVDLSDAAQIVLRAQIRKQAELEPERAPGLAPGFTRLYIEADTQSLIAGSAPVGESLRYLVDVPLDSRGRAPKLKKRDVLLFGAMVPGRPGQITLSGPSAQFMWDDTTVARLRPILRDLVAADAPPVITGVRDALSVAGNLAGESETQVFLDTQTGDPASISVVRRPGAAPVWGVSFSEIVDQAARPPAPQTLAWYRLACFLPARLPAEANLSRDAQARQRAEADYAFVMSELGVCERNLT